MEGSAKYYRYSYEKKEDIPQEIMDKMRYGFVMKYGDDIVTGWCVSFQEVAYNSQGLKVVYTSQGVFNSTDIIGFRLNEVILNLDSDASEDGTYYYHTFVTVKDVPMIFFPKEIIEN